MQGHDLFREKTPGTMSTFIAAYALPMVVTLGVDAITAAVFGEKSVTTAFFGLLTGTVFLVGLARYGTVLPAIVEGGDTSLKIASTRSRLWPVLGRMLAVSAVGAMVAIAVIMVFAIVAMTVGGAVNGLLLIVANFLVIASIVCTLITTGVILCNAYRGSYA